MNKAELIEAIYATIAPNNVKGITAESLANLLIEIVNAAGDGGGVGSEYIDMTLADPDNMESMELTADAKVHNAERYNKILSIRSSNSGVAAFPVVSMGGSELGPFVLYSKALMFGEGYIDFIFSLSLESDTYNNIVVVGQSMYTGETDTVIIGMWSMDVVFRVTPDGNAEILM